MEGRLAAVAVLLASGCTTRDPESGRGSLDVALALAAESRGCADELWRAAGTDPGTVAALLDLAPAAVAPWGGAARAPGAVRAEVLARAAAARDAAGAARSLALLGEHASAEQDALRRERIVRCIELSGALCDAAARLRGGLVAHRPAR